MVKVLSLSSALLVGVSLAVGAQDPFDRKLSNFALLQDKGVQKEVKITETQRKKMNAVADGYRKAMQGLEKEAQAQKGASPALEKKARSASLKLRESVLDVLTGPQLKRLRELTVQAAGLQAYLDDAIAKRVGINADQLKKLRSEFVKADTAFRRIQQESVAKVQPKYKDQKPKDQADAQRLQLAYNQEVQAELSKRSGEINKLQQDVRVRMVKLLKPGQEAAVKALGGVPYKPKAGK